MGKRGPQPMEPTDKEREMVKTMAAVGITQEDIALMIRGGICVDTLVTHFGQELRESAIKANAAVGGWLYKKCKAGDTASLIFWAKTRMRWKTTEVHENVGANGKDLIPATIDFSKLSPEELRLLEPLIVKASVVSD